MNQLQSEQERLKEWGRRLSEGNDTKSETWQVLEEIADSIKEAALERLAESEEKGGDIDRGRRFGLIELFDKARQAVDEFVKDSEGGDKTSL